MKAHIESSSGPPSERPNPGVVEGELPVPSGCSAAGHRLRLTAALLLSIAAATVAAVGLGAVPPAQRFLQRLGTAANFSRQLPAAPPLRQASLDPAIFESDQGLPLSRMLGLGVRTIILDPGHGGEDAGAVGRSGGREKDLALDIALRLKRRLAESAGTEVLLTRTGDERLSLQERVAIAYERRADIFVSIHLNFLPSRPLNIVETFYFGPARDASSADLALRENAGAGFWMSEFRTLVERMGRELRLEESRALAIAVNGSLYRTSRRADAAVRDFGVKRGPFVVLNQAEIPAILAEVSCLSDPREETRLGTAEHRENLAAALEAGILDYLTSRGLTREGATSDVVSRR